jgi:hypothetical protein
MSPFLRFGVTRMAANPAKNSNGTVTLYSGMMTALRRRVSPLLAVNTEPKACGHM